MAEGGYSRKLTEKTLRSDYESLLHFTDNRTENVEYFYHATDKESYMGIKKKKTIIGHQTLLPDKAPLALCPTDEKKLKYGIKGVWFCISLFQHSLPDRSPYGEYRIDIPINSIVENMEHPRLFFECVYHFPSSRNDVLYARVVLIDKSDEATEKEYHWCKKNLVKLSRHANDLFNIVSDDSDGYRYECAENWFGQQKGSLYVEVLVVGDVHVESVPSHVKVECTERATNSAAVGMPSRLLV